MGENILIINLTRMGDLIQTSPAIAGIVRQRPEARVTMLANAKFAATARFIPGVDELLTFDPHQFGSPDGVDEVDVLAMYDYLDGLAAGLAARRFDRIINLSHSKASAMLALLIGAPDIRGFGATQRGERMIRDPWLIYFTSLLAFRKLNRFNLVDLYLRGSGAVQDGSLRLSLNPARAPSEGFTRALTAHGVREGDLVIGIQAGASREDRRWDPRSFAAVADRLARERGAKIVLFGAPSEKKLGDQVAGAMAAPAINLIGQTGLGELVHWVKRLDLLITNDTGTMHIAAALGRPIVALFFVHARAEETGPYCENAIVLQADIECAPCTHQTVCGHMTCLRLITPDDVAAASFMALDGTKELPKAPGLFARTLVYRSAFNFHDRMIDFVPIRYVELRKEELFAYVYRPLMIRALEAWDGPERMPVESDFHGRVVEELTGRFTPPPRSALNMWTARALEGASEMAAAAAQGERLAAALAAGEVAAQETARALADLDARIATLGATHEGLTPLAMLYRRRTENLEGATQVELARSAARAHGWLRRAALLLGGALGKVNEGLRRAGFAK